MNINKLIGLPELASEHGEMVDHMLGVLHWFMLVLFVGWTAFFLYILFRFRARRQAKANYHGIRSHFSTHLEIGVVIVEAVLLLGFAFPLWAVRVNDFPTEDNVVRVRAVAWQYGWTFHYPGPDGMFGRVAPKYYSVENKIGLDPNDPNGKDDITSTNNMILPVNRSAIVNVTSKDVVHNLHLYTMRIAQDAIPGMEVPMWFKPTKVGRWESICGQLCGLGHASMVAYLEVVESDEAYEEWLAKRAALLNKS